MTSDSTWMSSPQIQSLTLGALKLPGTHDSGSYSLTSTLSQIQYPDIAFLWKLSPDDAPVNGSLPWAGGTYYVGQAMYTFVLNVALAVAQSQDQDILQQLNGGIRYFDLRVYYDSTANDFYVQHGLRGATLTSILQQVQAFIQANPTSGELIFLQLSHTNFATNPVALTSQVAALVNQYLGGNVYLPAGAAGTVVDFQSLSTLTLASITNGKPAVMLLNTDIGDGGYTYASTVINTSGFSNSGRSPNGVDTVPQLTAAEQGPLQANPANNLYQINWTLTPQVSDIMTQIQNSVLGNGATPILEQLALEADNSLPGFIQANQSAAFNLITVDWYETGTPQTVVDICVPLNAGG